VQQQEGRSPFQQSGQEEAREAGHPQRRRRPAAGRQRKL